MLIGVCCQLVEVCTQGRLKRLRLQRRHYIEELSEDPRESLVLVGRLEPSGEATACTGQVQTWGSSLDVDDIAGAAQRTPT